ncbi:MAG: (4Fe-4S)-binding protein [Bacteroidota bacterium]
MSEKKIVKHYSNGEITVVWQPAMCIHSEKCFHGLPGVFNPNQRPWVNVEASDSETIVNQVKTCPSGALSYFSNEEGEQKATLSAEPVSIQVAPNGPLILKGSCIVTDAEGNEVVKENMTAFCRCGASENKPYCDGSHKKIDFQG